MVKEKTVAVIMPCYNEGVRVLNVLRAVKQAKLVNEIIVVDDGSDGQTKKMLNKISRVKVITHPKNLGKSQAMKTGLLSVKSDIVVFVDCDLCGFKGSYIDSLVKPIINDELDLVLGDREKEIWIGKLIGLADVVTGERAIKRDLLLENMRVFDYGGYLIEVAMNRIFFKTKRVGKFLLKNVEPVRKRRKVGWIGLWNDIVGLVRIIKFLGWREFVSQLIFVGQIRKIGY